MVGSQHRLDSMYRSLERSRRRVNGYDVMNMSVPVSCSKDVHKYRSSQSRNSWHNETRSAYDFYDNNVHLRQQTNFPSYSNHDNQNNRYALSEQIFDDYCESSSDCSDNDVSITTIVDITTQNKSSVFDQRQLGVFPVQQLTAKCNNSSVQQVSSLSSTNFINLFLMKLSILGFTTKLILILSEFLLQLVYNSQIQTHDYD